MMVSLMYTLQSAASQTIYKNSTNKFGTERVIDELSHGQARD